MVTLAEYTNREQDQLYQQQHTTMCSTFLQSSIFNLLTGFLELAKVEADYLNNRRQQAQDDELQVAQLASMAR